MESGYDECIRGFEEHKKITSKGIEYWHARELMELLDYANWVNFKGVLEKARAACKSSGVAAENHFADTSKMVSIGSGAQRESEDCYLTRYACYLVAMNADSSKPVVGFAMTYFAVQTRRQEVQQQLSDEEQRLELRMRLADNNRKLAGAAKQAGVVRYPIFQDAGYRGMYGMGLADVKAIKRIDASEDLLDNVGRLELSAHDFRATLTEERLNRDQIKTEQRAIETHKKVGEEVRQVMVRDNGVRPENLPSAPSIKRLVQRQRKNKSKMIKDGSKG
jgi:DNA-damage-inducible protein D